MRSRSSRLNLTDKQIAYISKITALLDPELRHSFVLRVETKLSMHNQAGFVTDALLTDVTENILEELGFTP